MHSRFFGLMLPLCLGSLVGLSQVGESPAWGQPRKKTASSEAGGDKTIEKQSAWEQKVMGEDGAKQADMKKIAAAQKLAEEARKNPPPEPAPKYKDPNKQGARAKNEASIGLPIESEEAQKSQGKRTVVAKKAEPSNSANDELGALVAASLASDKGDVRGGGSTRSAARASDSGGGGRGKSRKLRASKGRSSAAARSSDPPSSLDRIFAAGK
jgi:hypothetical protein